MGLYGFCLVAQGEVRLRRGEATAAIPLLRQGWERLGQEVRAGSPTETGAALALAEGYRLGGQLDQAEPILRRLLVDTEKSLGHEHPQYAQALVELGNVLLCRGDRTAAASLYGRAYLSMKGFEI